MRIKSGLYTSGVVAVAMMMQAGVAQAQSANITASATVAAAVTASNVQNLSFGTVIPTFVRTIATTDAANAGIVKIAGGVNAEVSITLGNLVNLSGPAVLTTSYAAGYSLTQTGSQTAFTPASGATTRLDATTGNLYIFLGGSVSPTAGQAAGSYSNTVSVTAAYTGN